jgi:Secretion system C-terminal sorting domain
MKKVRFKAFASIIILFGILFSVTINTNYYKRKKYERFLLKDIQSLNLEYKSEGTKPAMDKPEMAGIQDYYMTIDPELKRVPHERYVSAIKETLRRSKGTKSELSDRYEWLEVPADMGGRVRSFMFDPNDTDDKKVWAGSVTGGLWYNNNIYTDSIWHPVSDLWENLSISSIVADPNNSQIFYVGTGEPQTAVTIYRESSTRGVGIWKTTDAGETWQLLPNTSEFPYISDIIVKDETGTSAIYAGVVSGTHQGEDHTSSPSDGVYKSTDGGTSWSQVLPNINGQTVPYSPSDIELAASGRIFVGTYRNINGYGGASILYSDNGTSWNIFADYNDSIQASTDATVVIPGRTMLTSSPSEPNTIYAVIAAGGYTAQNWIYYRGRYILKSTDNGANWEQRNLPYSGSPWATLAWHALTIKVDPNNPNTLYAGGLNMSKSTDGGLSWQEISIWWNFGPYYHPDNPPYLHADQHSITFKPGNSDTICFTNDGGVFMSPNGTDLDIEFIEKNKNFNTLQFYTCDLNPDSASVDFVGGLQDNGTVVYKGPPIQVDQSFVSGGDGAYCFYDKDNYLITTVYYNRFYVFKENGSSYTSINSTGEESGTFISPSAYDDYRNTLYANAVSFTGDQANQILRVKNILTENPIKEFITLGTASAVHFSHLRYSKYSTQTQTNLYVGTQAGLLYKITNAQGNPETTDIGDNAFPIANISCIEEGKDENELLVTFSNYGVSSVWYTNDGGTSWSEKEGNLPDMPIRWALFDPEDTTKVMLATELGVWGTNDIHAEPVIWEPLNNGLPKVRIDMLRLREWDNTILAATHGRGLFYCDLEGGSEPQDPISTTYITTLPQELEIDVYPNPNRGILKLKYDNFIEHISISIYNENGSLQKTFSNVNANSELNISDLSDGLYFVKINAGGKETTKKIILQK